jgi:hypothetical protein
MTVLKSQRPEIIIDIGLRLHGKMIVDWREKEGEDEIDCGEYVNYLLNEKGTSQKIKDRVWEIFVEDVGDIVQLNKIEKVVITVNNFGWENWSSKNDSFTFEFFASFRTTGSRDFEIHPILGYMNAKTEQFREITNSMLSRVVMN